MTSWLKWSPLAKSRAAALAAMAAGMVVTAVVVLADDHIVDADRTVDFSTIKTFTIRTTAIRIDRPELNNPLVISNTANAIRATLASRGVTETLDRADVIVDFTVTSEDYSIGPFGRANRVTARGRGQQGADDPQSHQPVAFTDGALVLDLTARESGLLIWRGVYRATEKDSTKFAQALPDEAKTLLSEYPPRRK